MAKDISDSLMKKVLVIAYSFPPAGGGRVRRVLKFVKFLPEFGWRPVVLTVRKPVVTEYDQGLLKEIHPDTRVFRTNSLEPPNRWKSSYPSLKKGGRGDLQAGSEGKGLLNAFLCRMKYLLFFPDSRLGWIPFCVCEGYRIIKREKIDVIFVSAEPFSSFIAAVILKKLTRKPLIVDFRDEWVGFSDYYFPDKPGIIRKMEKIVEGVVVKTADKVVSVTNPIIENFINRYPAEKKDKFVCITNGFDPDDFKDISPAAADGKFTVTYTGALYKLRSPEYFLAAVKLLAREEPAFLQDVRVRFAGSLDDYTAGIMNNSALNGIIQIDGFLSHREALAAMFGSELLLFIEDQVPVSRCLLPAKLFEYMAAGRPILALAGQGCVKEVIEYTNCGRAADSLDVREIAGALGGFYDSFRKKRRLDTQADYSRIMNFSRRTTTRQFSRVLDECFNAEC